MPVDVLPIPRDLASHAAEDMRRQVRYRDPGQNQKARVVGEKANVAPPRLATPADEAVAARQVSRRRTPRQTGHRSPLCPHQILQVLSHRLLIAQVVKLFHQTMEQRFVSRAPHELNLNRTQRPQRHR